MTTHNFSEYETLLAEVTVNAGEKIINSAVLYKTKHAYRESLFLLLIAQEELAKLILLPFANAAEEIDRLIDTGKHTGPYFNHRVKQKIFTSFGLQNRTYEQLEDIKQSCLYTGHRSDGTIGRYVARDEDTHEELCRATKLYIHLAVYNLGFAKPLQISPELKKVLAKFTNHIFIPALTDLTPSVIQDAQKYSLERSEKDMKIFKGMKEGTIASNKHFQEVLTTSPFMYTDILSYVLAPEDYRQYFKDVTGMNVTEMVAHLSKFIK